MATLRVRYRNGETDEWRLTDELAMELSKFLLKLLDASAKGAVFSFPISPEEGAPGTDFGYVALRLEEVVGWHLDGFVNSAAAAAVWAEMEGPSESE
jgi:hypothetical protein